MPLQADILTAHAQQPLKDSVVEKVPLCNRFSHLLNHFHFPILDAFLYGLLEVDISGWLHDRLPLAYHGR